MCSLPTSRVLLFVYACVSAYVDALCVCVCVCVVEWWWEDGLLPGLIGSGEGGISFVPHFACLHFVALCPAFDRLKDV